MGRGRWRCCATRVRGSACPIPPPALTRRSDIYNTSCFHDIDQQVSCECVSAGLTACASDHERSRREACRHVWRAQGFV